MVFAATYTGLYVSFNGGQNWGTLQGDGQWVVGNEAPGNMEVRDAVFLNDSLYIAGYGQGVYKATVPVYPRVF